MAELPLGQYESEEFPRFGLTPFAYRFPREVERVELQVGGEVECPTTISDALQQLPRVEQVSDFHCVTTWSRLSLAWSGYRFSDFYESIVRPTIRPRPEANIVMLRGQDGYESSLPLADLLADDVLLADQLEGEPLSVEHGAPLRLVVPAHYGYKSMKHLSKIRFCDEESFEHPSKFRFMQHQRGRVAFEERARGIPGWLLRFVYRPLIRSTAARFHRAMQSYGSSTDSEE